MDQNEIESQIKHLSNMSSLSIKRADAFQRFFDSTTSSIKLDIQKVAADNSEVNLRLAERIIKLEEGQKQIMQSFEQFEKTATLLQELFKQNGTTLEVVK